jgi:2-aminoadipate transaminase
MKIKSARRMNRMQASTIREILKITKRRDVISFAGGLPAPELFPVAEFTAAIAKALSTDAVGSLQYDVTEGYRPLKEWLCGWLERHGIPAAPDHMMLTNGSQQALDLVGKILLDPGDRVIVENPTYLGAIQAFNAYQPKYTTVAIDDQGPIPEAFEKACRAGKPKFVYLVPTFQNPSGITMSLARRKTVLKVARQYGLPILEDDPYGYLRFTGSAVPSLFSLAKGKGVIYMSTLSKILSPGIRVGFVLAEPDVIHALVLAKQAADLQPNSLIQRAVYHYAQAGHFERHIPKIIDSYRERSDWMLDAMKRHFPSEVTWIVPEGGMFVWCTLPKGLSAQKLFAQAVANNVAYVTGSVFYANGGGDNTLRLNFTNSTKEQIETGIERLGELFRKHL